MQMSFEVSSFIGEKTARILQGLWGEDTQIMQGM
jgi:hypothetical protein